MADKVAPLAPSDEVVTAKEAARRIGVGASTIRAWIFLGRLPAEREGWFWRIKVSDLDKANEESLAGAGAKQRYKRGRIVRDDDAVVGGSAQAA